MRAAVPITGLRKSETNAFQGALAVLMSSWDVSSRYRMLCKQICLTILISALVDSLALTWQFVAKNG